MNIKDELEKYLLSEVVIYHDKKTIEPDEDLLTQGLIDSMGILQLVNFVEKTFAVEVGDEEIVPENFRSLNCLNEFIKNKKSNQLA